MKQKKYFLLFLHGKKADELSDEECIRRFIAGEEKYCTILYERYRPELLRYLGSFIGNRQDCEEIMDDVFTEFILLLRSGKYQERGKAHNLLMRMARNDVMNHINHQHLHDMLFAEQAEDFDSPDEGSEEAYNPGREKMLRLRDALRNLSEKELQIFMLRYHGKASFEEIGKKLNMNPHTAMSVHARTMEKLRKAVAGNI